MSLNQIIQIGDKIKNYRKKLSLNQAEIADKLEIPRSTYANYENNNREPSIETLNKICDFFNISIETLLQTKCNQTIGENIKKYRKKLNLTQEQLGIAVNRKAITIRKYESNKISPGLETFFKIITILKIPPQNLFNEFTDIPNTMEYLKSCTNCQSETKELKDYSTLELFEELEKRFKDGGIK